MTYECLEIFSEIIRCCAKYCTSSIIIIIIIIDIITIINILINFFYYADGKPEADDVTIKTVELQNLAQSFREHSVEYVLEVSSLGEEITRWGPVPDRSQTLIPQLSKYLVNVNEVKLVD